MGPGRPTSHPGSEQEPGNSFKWGEMIPLLVGLCPEVVEERNACWHGSSGRSPPSRGILAGPRL